MHFCHSDISYAEMFNSSCLHLRPSEIQQNYTIVQDPARWGLDICLVLLVSLVLSSKQTKHYATNKLFHIMQLQRSARSCQWLQKTDSYFLETLSELSSRCQPAKPSHMCMPIQFARQSWDVVRHESTVFRTFQIKPDRSIHSMLKQPRYSVQYLEQVNSMT